MAATATAAPIAFDPKKRVEDYEKAAYEKALPRYREVVFGLHDKDPAKRAAAEKAFPPKDWPNLVIQMGIADNPFVDFPAAKQKAQLEKKREAYGRDKRKKTDRIIREVPGKLKTAVEHYHETEKMILVMDAELRSAKMDRRADDQGRETTEQIERQNPRLFDAPPEPVASKPAADGSVNVKPTPTDDRNKTVTLHEVPIEGQDRQDDKPATGGGRPPLILPDIAPDDRADPTGQDHQEDYDPLGR